MAEVAAAASQQGVDELQHPGVAAHGALESIVRSRHASGRMSRRAACALGELRRRVPSTGRIEAIVTIVATNSWRPWLLAATPAQLSALCWTARSRIQPSGSWAAISSRDAAASVPPSRARA